MEFKFPSQIKTKGRLPGAKNKKRSNIEAELEESSTCRDLSRFEHDVDQTSQIGVENGGVGRGGRVGRANQVGKVGRARGERNRCVTTNRTRVEEAGIAETD